MRQYPPCLEVYEDHKSIICIFYNHFKATNSRLGRNLFLTIHLFFNGAAVVKKIRRHKNLTNTLNKIALSQRSMTPFFSGYTLCMKDLICKQKYITDDYMLTLSDISFELKSSTLVSNSYGLIRHILYLISVAPYCKFTVPLLKHCVIKNGPVYRVSYLYSVCLVIMTLSPTV